jgi:hypothetical protein
MRLYAKIEEAKGPHGCRPPRVLSCYHKFFIAIPVIPSVTGLRNAMSLYSRIKLSFLCNKKKVLFYVMCMYYSNYIYIYIYIYLGLRS